MTHIPIRPLLRGDLPRIAHLVDANAMFPSAMLDDMTAAYFAGDSDTQRWIVADTGSATGVAYTVPEPLTEGTWNTLCICVDPAAHGQGIGTALMRQIEGELAAEGARVLLVETSGTPDFERTRGFYDMLGYEREARIRDYYSAGDDKIIFRKALI
ncbi:GNAT family N-acetyltransferase [Erythrobacter donghaensis]|jgi:ribosomal protein S18 acetylase RimI-like enzyme|uniref:GNAT family N-acetyltransferase n=2 Tax=Erythrobacter donghaensis TaxID=267135 RepID=UPI00093AB810|nr:GNAT family N-acetyltransferase [Erythrobacter donghaensis]